MKNLAKYSVDRAITVFMAVIIVVVFGIVSYTRLSTDLFPSMNIPYTVVVTTYIGASPEEVEEVVTKPLEATLATTTNIKQVTSTSQENVSLVILEFNSDANMDSAVIEMRENLDLVLSNLPDEVGSPMIIKLNPDMMPIMQFSVSKEGLTQQELTNYVNDDVLPYIERVAGVASVSVSGAYESEVRVILDDTQLATLNAELTGFYTMIDPLDESEDMLLSKDLISDILMAQNFEFPVGYAGVEGVNYLVRVGEEFNNVEEINNLILFDISEMMNGMLIQTLAGFGYTVDADNAIEDAPTAMLENPIVAGIYNSSFRQPITLSQILVEDEAGDRVAQYVNANDKEYSKINGNNAISITVQKSASFATTDVTEEVLRTMSTIEENDGTTFTVLLDQGEYIQQATGGVSNNLLYGALLAVVVLLVFLRSARATLIVGLSIPISLLFAIVLIYLAGITLNIVSLGGLALGIGMLVDNSIVVMENIFRLKKEGKSNREAAIEGTKQVAGAIVASTITTIAVFVPIIFIEGFIKEIFMQMALTIAFSLSASLVIALTLVPSMSSRILKENSEVTEKEERGINWIKKGYEIIFTWLFKAKVVVLVVVVLLFGGSIYLALSNGFEYFPESDEGQLTVSITNPTSSPISYEEFVTVLDDFSTDVMTYDDVNTIGITLGSLQGSFMGFSSSDAASASIILKDDREMSTKELEHELNELLLADYSMIEFEVSGSQQTTAMLTGSGIQVELRGNDLDTLKAEAITIANILNGVEGISEVDNGVGKEADEIKITVDKDEAIKFNVMTAMVLGAVAGELAGEEKVTGINVDGDLYDVYVYDYDPSNPEPEDIIDTIEEINMIVVGQTMDMTTSTMVDVYVQDVATVETVKGFSSISRVDGSRTITISGTFGDGVNTTDVARDVEDALANYNAPEGYEFTIQGENEEVMEAVNVLVLAILLAVVLIYMIMASQFQSLTYPFIIMFTIPLAFTGGFAILWMANLSVSVVALIGFVILVGVVVNNGIVLVDYINQLVEKDIPLFDALLEAGKTRLRPIVMTALTTILALSTMALGFGEGAEMMQPMAVTTVGGLLYATVLTLFIVPIMYYLVTKYSKEIFGYGVSLVAVAAGIVGFILLESVLALVAGIVLALAIVAWLVIPLFMKGSTVE